MTSKLYYDDAYIKEFSSVVLSCDSCERGYDIVMRETAFFPEEGGQYSDKGYIDGVRVLYVNEREGVIHHYVEDIIDVGKEVECTVDFDERYEKMQCHTGEHILSGIIHDLYGLDNVGFHLGADDVTMDISAPLTREQLDKVELLANEIIYKNIPVTTRFPSAEELRLLKYRSKLDLTENVRIVDIGEYDSCACCAPHVAYTGEIGLIKILDFAKLRGGIRIHITAGRRAIKAFREYYNNALAVSGMLSVPKSDIADGVKKTLEELVSLKNAYAEERISKFEREAQSLENITGNHIVTFSDASIEEMIRFSNIALERVSGILILLSGNDGEYKYVISSSSTDLKAVVSDINKSLLGRGGGKSNMIQGSFGVGIEEIKGYFL